MKQGSYPEKPSDGILLIDNQEKNAYKTNGFEITGLTNGTTYYFALFPYSATKTVNTSYENRISGIPKEVSIYGIKRSLTSSATTWERLEDAVDLTANATHDGTEVTNDFDNLYPWSDIKSCDVSADGTVNSWYGDADFSFTNPIGHIMTYFPEFWWKRVQSGDYEYIYIADADQDGFTYSEPFYLGRYDAGGSSSAVTCKSGEDPFINVTVANARTYSKNIGTNWGLMDIWKWSVLQMLYLVEYADYDSQTILGYGNCNTSAEISNGGCDSLGMKSGCLSDDKASAVIYRGVENPFGNVYQWLDGINMTSGTQAYVCSDRDSYETSITSSPYNKLGYACPSSSDYIKTIGYDSSNPSIQMPTAVGGSSSTYIPDRFGYNSSGVAVYVGGNYSNVLYCGLWCWNSNAATYSRGAIGFRLLFVPA